MKRNKYNQKFINKILIPGTKFEKFVRKMRADGSYFEGVINCETTHVELSGVNYFLMYKTTSKLVDTVLNYDHSGTFGMSLNGLESALDSYKIKFI